MDKQDIQRIKSLILVMLICCMPVFCGCNDEDENHSIPQLEIAEEFLIQDFDNKKHDIEIPVITNLSKDEWRITSSAPNWCMATKVIDENMVGVHDQTAGDFHAAPFAAGQLDTQAVAELGDGKFFHQGFHFFMLLLLAELRRLQHGQEVVFDGELAENRRFLRQIADAIGRPLVNGQVGDVLAINGYLP